MLGIIDLLSSSQDMIHTYIGNKYSNFIKQKHNKYLVLGRGDNPKPMLCVHLDTINSMTNDSTVSIQNFVVHNDIVSLDSKSILRCLGGDDRAGVYIALELLNYMINNNDYKYDIGFFKDEESGCYGSDAYKTAIKAGVVDNINTTCYIGLDRRSPDGKQQVALYGMDNKELTSIFTSLGYEEAKGSISDCSNLAGEIACINLSVGYDHEHSTREVLYLNSMKSTLEALKEVSLGDVYYKSEETIDDEEYWTPWRYDNDYEDTVTEYIYELEEENKILKDTLADMGFDVDKLLKEEMYYYYG